jgi:hypothetical protein
MSGLMRNVLMIGVALVLALPLLAQQSALDQLVTVTTVHWWNDLSMVENAEAVLIRMEHGLAMSFTSFGMEPGDVVTIWWVIFDEPENCSNGECSLSDIFLMDRDGNYILDGNGRTQLNRDGVEAAQISNFWAAGTIVDEDGSARFKGHMAIGDTTADTLFGSALQNPMSAEVHLVARTHGPIIPGLIHEQLLTGWGGCPNPDDRSPCKDIQVAFFLPP